MSNKYYDLSEEGKYPILTSRSKALNRRLIAFLKEKIDYELFEAKFNGAGHKNSDGSISYTFKFRDSFADDFQLIKEDLLFFLNKHDEKTIKYLEEVLARDSEQEKDLVGNIKKKTFINNDLFEIIAEDFLEKAPCYYDRNKYIFLYNKDMKKWIMADQTDLVNIGKYVLNKDGLNVGKVRSAFINAVLDKARWTEPKEVDKTWVQFEDQFYDIKNEVRLDVSKEYFSQIKIPHNLGESEETPIIDKKIIDWVGEKQYKLFVQICAYAMYKDYPFARFFIFHGTGQDGKSTAGEFMRRVIGNENTCTVDIDQLANNRFEAQKLYQKTFAICGEVDYKLLENTRKLKGVTGNDPVTIEFKNKNSFTYNNFAKLVWYANGVPPTYDKTQGFYRRTVIVKFPNKFEECVDPLDDITEQEYENFCLKCMTYLKDLLKNGFDEETVEEKKRIYEELSNPLIKFAQDHLKESDNPELLLVGDLYAEYQKYAKKNALLEFSYKDFLVMVKNLDEITVVNKRVYVHEDTGKSYENSSEFTGYSVRRNKSFIRNMEFCPTCPTCPSTSHLISLKEKLSENTLDTLDTLDNLNLKGNILTSDVLKAMISEGGEVKKSMLDLYDNQEVVYKIVNSFLEKGIMIETKKGVFVQCK